MCRVVQTLPLCVKESTNLHVVGTETSSRGVRVAKVARAETHHLTVDSQGSHREEDTGASAKVDAVLDLVRSAAPSDSIVIFPQFTRLPLTCGIVTLVRGVGKVFGLTEVRSESERGLPERPLSPRQQRVAEAGVESWCVTWCFRGTYRV